MGETMNKTALAERGHNQPPDYAQEVTDRMAADYAEMASTATSLLEKARGLPETIDSEETLHVFSEQIVDMRDTAARAESTRKAEKEPYYRAGQAVDGFFNTLGERLEKGMAVLSKRVTEYKNKILAEERERRRLEAEATARVEREKAIAAAKAAAAAEEARLAADRARKAENIEQKAALAAVAEAAAADANASASIAADAAEAAHIETLRKPAEMARSRFDGGRLVTMKQVGFVEITDKMALDPAALWPFIKDEAALVALRAWAKTSNYKKPMAGAIVELRDEAVVR